MKKFTILIASILISIGTSYGQGENGIEGSRFSAGRWYLGGSFIATSQTEKHEDSSGSSDGPKNSTFKLVPKAGYIINDKISVFQDDNTNKEATYHPLPFYPTNPSMV